MADLAMKSYDIVKEELNGKPNRRKRMQYAASSSTGDMSDRTEVVVVPVKQSPWSKRWESLKEKVRFCYLLVLFYSNLSYNVLSSLYSLLCDK